MAKAKKTKLKRTLGIWEVTLAGVGIILGAGIYALIGKAAGIAGAGIWISFLIAAGIAALTGLSYAELSSMYSKAGAEYVYAEKAFGKRIAFIIGWLIAIGGSIGSAAVALGFGGYLAGLFPGIDIITGAVVLIISAAFLLSYGVKESTRAAIIGTLIEAAGLILIIFLGIPYLGSIDYFEPPDVPGVLSAAALIFFAYIGFEQIARLAEETKNPAKNIPKAIVFAVIFTSIIYVLVAISSISILSPELLAVSNAPLADVAAKAFGPEAHILLSIIALFATANTVLLIQLASSRLVYGMAEKSILSYVHPKSRTPLVAIVLVTITSLFLLSFGAIEDIAYLTDFTVFAAFIAVNGSLIWLRYKKPKAKRPFKVPTLILPILGVISSFLIIFTIPLEIVFYGVGLIVLGIIIDEFIDF